MNLRRNEPTKTPEEIKNGLKHCSEDGCKGCNYEYECNMADGFSTLAYDALAYIQQLEAALPQWIRVEDRLPEHGRWCLAFGHKGKVHHMDIVKRGKTGTWEFGMMTGFEITHWTPLPPMPELDQEAEEIVQGGA